MCQHRYRYWRCCKSFYARKTERCGDFHKGIACVKESGAEYVHGECPSCETKRRAKERRRLRETRELGEKKLVSIPEGNEGEEKELDLESIGRAI